MTELSSLLMSASPARPPEHEVLVGRSSEQQSLDQASYFGHYERNEPALFLGAELAVARARSAESAA